MIERLLLTRGSGCQQRTADIWRRRSRQSKKYLLQPKVARSKRLVRANHRQGLRPQIQKQTLRSPRLPVSWNWQQRCKKDCQWCWKIRQEGKIFHQGNTNVLSQSRGLGVVILRWIVTPRGGVLPYLTWRDVPLNRVSFCGKNYATGYYNR